MGLPKGFRLNSPNYVYVIERVLGHGTFGITYLAKCNGRNVAIKEFFMHQFCGRRNESYEVTGYSPGNLIDYYGNKFKLEAANLKKCSVLILVIVLVIIPNMVYTSIQTAGLLRQKAEDCQFLFFFIEKFAKNESTSTKMLVNSCA